MSRSRSPSPPGLRKKTDIGNFIRIRIKDDPSDPPQSRMALRPPTLPTLLKNVTRLFNFPADTPARSLWDAEGDEILSMDDVPPGATVYISQLPTGAPPASSAAAADVSIAGSPARDQASTSGRRHSPTRTEKASSSSMLLVLDEGSSMSYRSRRKRRETVLDEFADEAEEDRDEAEFQASGISLRALGRLLGLLPPGVTIAPEDLAKYCSGLVLRLASAAERCQTAQEAALWRTLRGLTGDLPQVTEAVRLRAQAVIDAATVANGFTVFTKLRHAVIGPPKGGKSVFLRVLHETLIARFLASGQYRKTLVVFADLREAREELADPLRLYRFVVRLTFTHLAAQRLDVQPHRELLTGYFERLPSLDKLVPLPGRFALEDEFRGTVPILTAVADHFFNVLNTLQSLSVWLTNVVAFPRAVALAFGFGGVHFTVDHLEEADFELTPAAPLGADPQAVTILEFFKFMLSNDSFAVSGADEGHLIETLELLTDDGLDLRDGLECVSIVDVDVDHADRFLFRLRLADDGPPIPLRLVDCGGCSGFLQLWDLIIEQGDRVRNEEKKDSASKIAKELRLELLRKIRELAALLFWKYDDAEGKAVPLNKQIVAFEIVDTTTDIPEGYAGDQ